MICQKLRGDEEKGDTGKKKKGKKKDKVNLFLKREPDHSEPNRLLKLLTISPYSH